MAVINGSEKSDILNGTSSSDTIKGGGGDTINCLNGNDYILGGSRRRQIDGGNGIDTAIYEDSVVFDAAGFGNDIVGDFVPGQDRLQIDDAILADFAAVQSHMQQVGSHVVITFDASNTITL